MDRGAAGPVTQGRLFFHDLSDGQRVFAAVSAETRGPVLGRRIGTAALRESRLLKARAEQQRGQAVIPLEAPWFVIDPIRLVVLLGQLLLDRPGFGPYSRVVQS